MRQSDTTGSSLNIVFFPKILKYSGLWPFSVLPRCQCVYTHKAGRKPALAAEKSKILRKNTIFNEHPVVPPIHGRSLSTSTEFLMTRAVPLLRPTSDNFFHHLYSLKVYFYFINISTHKKHKNFSIFPRFFLAYTLSDNVIICLKIIRSEE